MGLSAERRRALGAAAVLGGRFARERLRRLVAADSTEEEVAELCAAGVLREDDAEAGVLRFASALLEQAAYAIIADAERAALHAAVAADLAGDPSVEPAQLLRHALGAGDAALVTLAHVLTSERAVALFDHRGALLAAAEGILSGASLEQLARLRLSEAEALLMAERYAEAEVRACEAAELMPPGSLRWMACLRVRVRAAQRRLDPAQALVAFDELAASRADGEAAAALARAPLARSAAWLILVGLVDEGEARAAIVEERVRLGGAAGRADADLCQLRARRAQARGEWGRYRDEFAADEERHRAHGDLPAALMSRLNHAHALFEAGLGEPAVELTRGAVDEARELGLGDVKSYCSFLLGLLLRRRGARAEGLAMLTGAVAGSDEDPRLVGEVALELALDALEDGDLVEAERHAVRGAALLEPSPASRAVACAVRSQSASAPATPGARWAGARAPRPPRWASWSRTSRWYGARSSRRAWRRATPGLGPSRARRSGSSTNASGAWARRWRHPSQRTPTTPCSAPSPRASSATPRPRVARSASRPRC
ncbi:MAG: hypothetical protein WKG00_34545 [Polyangiaceae bacterium]